MANALARLPGSVAAITATSARNDADLIASWLNSLGSKHTKRNFAVSAEQFMAALGCTLREATVEDVRQALEQITAGAATSTRRQYFQRVKSLLSYAHRMGYTPFNAGVAIKPPAETRALAKRIVGELDVRDIIRSARRPRDRVMLAVAYAAGLRVSELVALNCGDVIERPDKQRVQLHVVGKGGKERQVLLPETLGPMLRSLTEGRSPSDPVFRSQKGDQRLTDRAVNHLIKVLAAKAGLDPKLSAHWLRHAHASHALDRGAPSLSSPARWATPTSRRPASICTPSPAHRVPTSSTHMSGKPLSSEDDRLWTGTYGRFSAPWGRRGHPALQAARQSEGESRQRATPDELRRKKSVGKYVG